MTTGFGLVAVWLCLMAAAAYVFFLLSVHLGRWAWRGLCIFSRHRWVPLVFVAICWGVLAGDPSPMLLLALVLLAAIFAAAPWASSATSLQAGSGPVGFAPASVGVVAAPREAPVSRATGPGPSADVLAFARPDVEQHDLPSPANDEASSEACARTDIDTAAPGAPDAVPCPVCGLPMNVLDAEPAFYVCPDDNCQGTSSDPKAEAVEPPSKPAPPVLELRTVRAPAVAPELRPCGRSAGTECKAEAVPDEVLCPKCGAAMQEHEQPDAARMHFCSANGCGHCIFD